MDTHGLGLKEVEAIKILNLVGPNKLPEKPPPTDIVIFLSQLKNPLVYILFAAGVITLFLGHTADFVIIFFAVLINTVLGYIQERRAEKALRSLKSLVDPKARVIRDGKLLTISVSRVVPKDVIVLYAGDKVPADGKLIKANRIFVSEAILTGESNPVPKNVMDKVYMGTIVVSGVGVMEASFTGNQTEIGKIALKLKIPEEETPLKRQLKRFSRNLSFLVLILTTGVFLIGLIRGQKASEIFISSVALSVSAIPEGLLVGLTVVLAIGMQRILKAKGLVRHLISAETLGGVSTICIDKTGTLTEGKMKVISAHGDKIDLGIQSVVANDMDDPIVIAAHDWAKGFILEKDKEKYLAHYKRLDSLPFSSKERFSAYLNKWDNVSNMMFVNGAPEFLLDWCDIEDDKKSQVLNEIKKLTTSGSRVMAMARKKVSKQIVNISEKNVKNNLEFVGILAFSDPLRVSVKEALKKTMLAGIKIVVITGDYPETAINVLSQLGIKADTNSVITGAELSKLSKSSLADRLKSDSVRLFARTTPDQKLKIIESLKQNGEVVAMMGDGVNDALALKHADIGVVVDSASDVAKETADLILLDSNYETIIKAVEEGRLILDNIRKIILYLVSDAFQAIIAVGGSLVLGLPLPVTAAQILWINLISDGFPDLALTVDPKHNDIMRRRPHSNESLITSWMKIFIVIISFIGGVGSLGLFIYFYKTTNDLMLAQSVAFLAMGINTLIYVFSVRTLTKPFWVTNPFENKWLNLAVIAGVVLQILPFLYTPLGNFFGIKFPGILSVILVIGVGVFVFISIEIAKSFIRRQSIDQIA